MGARRASRAVTIREAAIDLAEIYSFLCHIYPKDVPPLDSWIIPSPKVPTKILFALDYRFGSLARERGRAPGESFHPYYYELYRLAYDTVVPDLGGAALGWAKQALGEEEKKLSELEKRLNAPGLPERLHEAARRIGIRAGGFGRTREEYEEAYMRLVGQRTRVAAWQLNELNKELQAAVRKRVGAAVREELAAAPKEPALDVREKI